MMIPTNILNTNHLVFLFYTPFLIILYSISTISVCRLIIVSFKKFVNISTAKNRAEKFSYNIGKE